MLRFVSIAIFLFVLCSRASAITQSEKNVGLSITNKIDSLLSRPGYSGRLGGGQTYLDMMLVLDSSGSIGTSEFREAKHATTMIVDYVDYKAQIRRGGSRVGLVQFSDPEKTRVVFSMGDYTSAWSVNNQINNLRYTKGTTATSKALRLANEEFDRQETSENAKVVWLLTDGKSNKGSSPIAEANRMRRNGVTVCVVAIGSQVHMAEINGIADPGCVYRVSSFGSFRAAMGYATNQSNGGPTTDSPGQPDGRPTVSPDFFGPDIFN